MYLTYSPPHFPAPGLAVRADKHSGADNSTRRGVGAVVAGITISLLLGATLPAAALWMPWATEKDKIAARLEQIWAALAKDQRSVAKKYLLGPTADQFIDMELAQLRRLKVKNVDCRVKEIRYRGRAADFALVKIEKALTTGDGKVASSQLLYSMRKVDGQWLLITFFGKGKGHAKEEKAESDRKRKPDREIGSNASTDQAAAAGSSGSAGQAATSSQESAAPDYLK
jgi:hypothetical protein